ncbi:uncharacterized protein ACA1_034530 [Acanthamoeba castellanii str. Neff]|uniref:Uncharacterized protein n=1 Tax=Acanthamoeba castellanii (strain ATCC 30010 / Neff) TaxID=1257118 RepID=L8HCZ6_ACACF|nr:uncharacterized protein ACA1_034530 [Acanthamoeba castellanii str. Neff]ELR22608.1 hypothetical protein ACA1_034530 [Acanthamoeba castellanii str. Neff]
MEVVSNALHWVIAVCNSRKSLRYLRSQSSLYSALSTFMLAYSGYTLVCLLFLAEPPAWVSSSHDFPIALIAWFLIFHFPLLSSFMDLPPVAVASGVVWARSIWWGFDLAARRFPDSFTAPVFAATISTCAFPILDYAEQVWFGNRPDSFDCRLAVKLSFLGGCAVWLTQRPTITLGSSLLLPRWTSELSLGLFLVVFTLVGYYRGKRPNLFAPFDRLFSLTQPPVGGGGRTGPKQSTANRTTTSAASKHD